MSILVCPSEASSPKAKIVWIVEVRLSVGLDFFLPNSLLMNAFFGVAAAAAVIGAGVPCRVMIVGAGELPRICHSGVSEGGEMKCGSRYEEAMACNSVDERCYTI